MDLTIYEIIQGPVISDKAYKLNKTLNKLFLNVHPQANKMQIKQALQKLFNVKVKDVNVQVRKGKNRMSRRKQFTGSDQKRAVVTLAEGYSLDLFDQTGSDLPISQGAPSTDAAKV